MRSPPFIPSSFVPLNISSTKNLYYANEPDAGAIDVAIVRDDLDGNETW